MASKYCAIVSIFRRICTKNVVEPFQPRVISVLAASIHTTPVPKWTICDNVLPRMVGAGNLRFDSPANNPRNFARKAVSKSDDDEDSDFEDVKSEFDLETDDEDKVSKDDDEVSKFDDTQSEED